VLRCQLVSSSDGENLCSKCSQIPVEWQAPRGQLHAASVCSPTIGKHVSHSSRPGSTKRARLSNSTGGTLGSKRSWDSHGWDATHAEESSISVFVFLLILMRGSQWGVRVKVLPVRGCRRLQPEGKLGLNSLETGLCVHLGALLSPWSRRLPDTPLEGCRKKGLLCSAQPPFFSSSPPDPISTISCHAGAKTAARSHLCRRQVP